MTQPRPSSLTLRGFTCTFFIAAAGLWSGCATTNVNKSQDNTSLKIRTQGNLIADIDVDMTKQLHGTARQATLFGLFDIESPEFFADGITYSSGATPSFFAALFDDGEGVKSAAAYKAISSSNNGNQNIDVLVAPQYVVRKTTKYLGIYKEITANVTGYAGHIKRIRNTTERATAPKATTTAWTESESDLD